MKLELKGESEKFPAKCMELPSEIEMKLGAINEKLGNFFGNLLNSLFKI